VNSGAKKMARHEGRPGEQKLDGAKEGTVSESPLFGVAMLKIAMELKRTQGTALDDILSGVLEKMNLPEADFRAFLQRNGGLLRAIAARRRY
jgi:hypothetical protein